MRVEYDPKYDILTVYDYDGFYDEEDVTDYITAFRDPETKQITGVQIYSFTNWLSKYLKEIGLSWKEQLWIG